MKMTNAYTKQNKIFVFLYICAITAGFLYLSLRNSNDKNRLHTLVIAFDAKITATDPRIIGSDAGSQYIEELRFLPLVSFDKQGHLINVLAKNIDHKGNQIIVSLKQGIHFANGQEITAEDVESTYTAILFPTKDSPPIPRKSSFSNMLSITAYNKYEVIFNLKNPEASFVNNLIVGILPKIAIKTEPIGDLIGKGYESGPFILTKIDAMRWHFVANTNFDYGPVSKLQSFNIKIIPDSTTRYAALIKGDVDIIQNSLDPDKIHLIENKMQNEFQVLKTPKLATTYIGFNFRDPILKQKNIREALSYAIDTESILKYRLRSNELPTTSMFLKDSFYFYKNESLPSYQKNMAISLLKESGLTLPIPLKLTVSSSSKTNVEIAKTIAINLKDVGFNITVENLENGVFAQHLNRGLVQMWFAPWVGFKDPDHLRFVFSSSMFPPAGANRGHYSNSSVDELLEKGRVEFDPLKRKEIYLKAQEILANDLPYLYLWHGTNVAVVSTRVSGFEVYADGRYWSLTNVNFK